MFINKLKIALFYLAANATFPIFIQFKKNEQKYILEI